MQKNPSPEASTVIITGAARGIGLATAHLMQEAGWHIVRVDWDEEALIESAKGFEDSLALVSDISDPEAVKDMIARTLNWSGRIDALVNNAGVADFGPIEETDFERWRKVMATNLDGVFLVTQAATPAPPACPRPPPAPPTSRSRPPPWTPALLPRPGPRAPVGGAKAPLSPACAHAPELQPPRHRARQPAHAHARVGARRHIVFAPGTGQRRIRGPAQQRMQSRRLTSHDRASRAAAASSMSFSSSAFLASSMTTRSARCDKSVMCSASTCRRPHALNTGMHASSAHEH